MSDINADQNQGSTSGANVSTAAAQPAVLMTATVTSPQSEVAPQPAVTDAGAQTAKPALQPATAESEQITLLRKIDSDIGTLSTKIDEAQKLAVRNGAIAGGVSGAVSGGIVALGLEFIRQKLGF